jgi:DNA repair protein RecO (recombination protein O)
MNFEKLNGIVINEVNVNESDKLLTILSDYKGKINVYAKGARNKKNSYSISSKFLCYSELVLFKGRNNYYLNSANVIRYFYSISDDIIKLIYITHIIEICRDIVQENQNSNEVLKLLLNTLHLLEVGQKSYEFVVCIFEIKILSILGFSPNLYECSSCKSKNLTDIRYDFSSNSILCKKCSLNFDKMFLIKEGVLKAIKYIVDTSIQELFKFSLNEKLVKDLKKFSSIYLNTLMEKEYNKLYMLNDIKI